MKITLLAFSSVLIVAFAFAAGACASRKPVVHYDPKKLLWDPIENDIRSLREAGATQARWTKRADGALRIRNLEQLHEAMERVGIPVDPLEREREQKKLEKLFHASDHTIQFGFACNFYELVFFDSAGRQIHAHR